MEFSLRVGIFVFATFTLPPDKLNWIPCLGRAEMWKNPFKRNFIQTPRFILGYHPPYKSATPPSCRFRWWWWWVRWAFVVAMTMESASDQLYQPWTSNEKLSNFSRISLQRGVHFGLSTYTSKQLPHFIP